MAEDPANVARFLAAIGEVTALPAARRRGPPYRKSRPLLRRQALGEETTLRSLGAPHAA